MRRPRLRVVVVDDSRLMRRLLSGALEQTGEIVVVGSAASPEAARAVIRDTDPDVVTLDVEMPGMGGLAFLAEMMRERPRPVVMISATTTAGAENTLTALELGAVDFVPKPRGRDEWESFAAAARAKVRAARRARLPRRPGGPAGARHPADAAAGHRGGPGGPAPRRPGAGAADGPGRPCRLPACELIAIGAWTGGVAALNRLMACMPSGAAPVLIAQHMPQSFTARFAARLARTTGLDVAEASDREVLAAGMVRIAPGDRHLRVTRRGDRLVTAVSGEPPAGGCRPSIDLLFASVAEVSGARAAGAILTGMGRDGAEGLARMRAAGAYTLGEAAESCVVYGMPRVAMELGAVTEELAIDRLAQRLVDIVTGGGTPPDTPSCKAGGADARSP